MKNDLFEYIDIDLDNNDNSSVKNVNQTAGNTNKKKLTKEKTKPDFSDGITSNSDNSLYNDTFSREEDNFEVLEYDSDSFSSKSNVSDNSDYEAIDLFDYENIDNDSGVLTKEEREALFSDEEATSIASESKANASDNLSFKQKIIRELISYALIIVAAFVVASSTNKYIIVNASIPTGSMIPVITEGNRIIGNRLAYTFSEPKRGDIIIFPFPDDEKVIYIKRIIGLPGDTVEIKNGIVYINGSELDESSYRETDSNGDYVIKAYGSYGPYLVPEDSYFMLGDNRNSSKDSRFWENQFVHKDKIIAKALFCYFPTIHLLK